MTGFPTQEDREYALSISCNPYTGKPRTHGKLLQMVREQLAAWDGGLLAG